ncbi:rhamnogalacturonan exolyase [Thermostilla marina]
MQLLRIRFSRLPFVYGLMFVVLAGGNFVSAGPPLSRLVERLDRGTAAIRTPEGDVAISWRITADDPDTRTFRVVRLGNDGSRKPIWTCRSDQPTFFIDRKPPENTTGYIVESFDGNTLVARSTPTVIWEDGFLRIPLRTLSGCRPNDASVGDLDGDGDYEIVLKQEMTPRDNSQRGPTGRTRLEAYTLEGKFLWRIDLGRNIREGAHYTPFLVYDFDGDGRAEVACRTSDGTRDGTGRILGDPEADYRNDQGLILTGREYLTVFDGRTGSVRDSVPYDPPRGDVETWGDDYGNRSDRFLACAAYLDGRHPSLVFARGYYTRIVVVAWDLHEGRLVRRWKFDTNTAPEGTKYMGQGNHNLAVADVDGDGRDEIIYGACAIDDDGSGLYSTGFGHGDALHVTDIDPKHPGLEVFGIHEHPSHPFGANLRNAATGEVLWGLASPDVGRGLACDVDPNHAGLECWAKGGGLRGIYDCRGRRIAERAPRECNFAVWWDGDLSRELLDGTRITKWNPLTQESELILDAAAFGAVSINGTKANPCLSADILGDWREEVIWPSADGSSLFVFSTVSPTPHRLVTLMHDPVYRLSIVWQNVGYNQPPHPGFFLGSGMRAPPPPHVETISRPAR